MSGEITISRCRSQLDIINSDKIFYEQALEPDAVVVMMNPGTSRPEDSEYIEKEYQLLYLTLSEKEMVLAHPDETQKRIMRIMLAKGWKHVRVINLSDIRQHVSEKLVAEIKNFNLYSNKMEHSIFSKLRRTELLKLIGNSSEKPILFAWGTQDCLNHHAVECLKIIKGTGVKAKKEIHFQHPLTTRASWIKSILKLI